MRTLCVSFGSTHLARINDTKWLEWGDFAKWLTQAPESGSKEGLGWYIPAQFDPVYRDSENFVARHAITFDFDRVPVSAWTDVLGVWAGLAFAAYTTYSHRPEALRFRVVMPLSRPAGFDEFQAVARRVATDIGIEGVARESFVPAQMMYSPARPKGAAYLTKVNDGEWLDVDAVLAEYQDWTDIASWPRRVDGDPVHAGSGEKVDPRGKPGIIGEFNRAFPISTAIERFELPYRRVR